MTKRYSLFQAAVAVLLLSCMAGAAGDLDDNGIVDLRDFAELSSTWQQTLPWGPDGLPPQLLAYWRLDLNAQDSQSSFNGTVYGDVVWVSGKDAKVGAGAIQMDGQDYIAIDADDFPILSRSLTIDAWVKSDWADTDQIFISKGHDSWQVGIESAGQKAFFSCGGLAGTSYLVSATSLTDGQWHHVAAVYNQSAQTISLYVDEILDAQANASGIVAWNDCDIWIGGDPQQPQTDHWWKGVLDNIRIFNYALSTAEIFQRKTWHVDIDIGNDSSNGQGRSSAFQTIQHAITTADSGDMILVWPGTYTESINFLGKAITLRSATEPAVIRCPDNYAFCFYTGEQADSIVENFIIKDCLVGVSIAAASPSLYQLTFANNDYAVDVWGYSFPTIQNCILWDNTYSDIYTEAFAVPVSYCCVERAVAGEGNISTDPLFADPNNGDYHLKSICGRCIPGGAGGLDADSWVTDPNNSPCIDAGPATLNPMRESMPNGGRINIGAYGGTPFASKSPWPLKADINLNGQVWTEDLEWFIADWLFAEP